MTYRLDGAAGRVLTGTLAGTATPTPCPRAPSATVSVTLPGVITDGSHTVYAVATPSGETATRRCAVGRGQPPSPNPRSPAGPPA